jgi:YggT family protein
MRRRAPISAIQTLSPVAPALWQRAGADRKRRVARLSAGMRPLRYGIARKHRMPRTMTSIFQILLLILNVIWFIMIVHIIMSWLLNFDVLNRRQPLVDQIWIGLNRLLQPIYEPLRRILPDTRPLDLAPLVALIAVYALRIVITNNMYAF